MLEKIKEELRLHSMKLAAVAAPTVGFFTYNQDWLFALLAMIPVDPLPRAFLALCLGLGTYFLPRFLRFLPQPELTDSRAMGKADAPDSNAG